MLGAESMFFSWSMGGPKRGRHGSRLFSATTGNTEQAMLCYLMTSGPLPLISCDQDCEL